MGAPKAPSRFLPTVSAHMPAAINDMAEKEKRKKKTLPPGRHSRQEGKHRVTPYRRFRAPKGQTGPTIAFGEEARCMKAGIAGKEK